MVSMSKSRRKVAGDRPKLRRRKRQRRTMKSLRQLAIIIFVATVILFAVEMTICLISPSWMSRVLSFGKVISPGLRGAQMDNSNDKQLQHDDPNGQHFSVVIVGAGIAGLTAAKTLEQQGIKDVLILEATSQWGGRIRSATNKHKTASSMGNTQSINNNKKKYFYPVDMGASFITDSKWLSTIAGVQSFNDSSSSSHWDWTTTPATKKWKNRQTTAHDMFRNYSWYEFVQDYLLPGSEESTINDSHSHSDGTYPIIQYNCVVDKINSFFKSPNGDKIHTDSATLDKMIVQVSCGASFSVTADAVLVTIPLPLLQGKQNQLEQHEIDGRLPPNDDIFDDDVDAFQFRQSGLQFLPRLPIDIQHQIDKHKAKMVPALKFVLEFKHKFYPDHIDFLKQKNILRGENDDDLAKKKKKRPVDEGVNPKNVYEFWADSEVRYDPKTQRPAGAKHYLVGQLLGESAKAYLNYFYGPNRHNNFYRTKEFLDDMARNLLVEFIEYMENVESFDEVLIRQNYVGYQIVHWTRQTFTPGILDCSKVKQPKHKDTDKNQNRVGLVPESYGRLFFAGEAFAHVPTSIYNGCGQAHGAALSGKQAALQILHSIRSNGGKSDGMDGDTALSSAAAVIPVPPDDAMLNRDLERFSIIRPEDAESKEFYSPFNKIWKDLPGQK